MKKLYFNWSSGKDSALALYQLIQSNQYEIDLLFTSVGKETERVSMHGLREELLKKQAEMIGIKLEIMHLPNSPNMEIYNQLMDQKMRHLVGRGYEYTAFGDIFLEDLKTYREEQLKKVGVKSLFPLWKRNTTELILEFIDLGFKSKIVSANAKWFGKDFVGQDISHELINALPKEVDPCGENGEFHTFCYDGPMFEKEVEFTIGKKEKHSYQNPTDKASEIGYWFCDLLPI